MKTKRYLKKHILKNYVRLLHKIKSLIECNSVDKPGKFEKDYMKIKFISDDNLSLNKILKLHILTIIVRSVFED